MSAKLSQLKYRIASSARTGLMLSSLAAHQRVNPKSAILIATPSHGNLGDHAIVYAQKRFLAHALPDYGVFEIQRYQYELARGKIQGLVRPTDLIVIDGGGNVGTLWPEENAKMNDIVSRFKDNPVVIFPQTAFFEGTEAGRLCERETAAAYAKNPRLVFFSRDRATFDKISEIAPSVRNFYVPDIVAYIDDVSEPVRRSDALMCLRDDKEGVLGAGSGAVIETFLVEMGLRVRQTSTVVSEPGRIFDGNRDAVLRSKWGEFASSELVVTDRLHGMYFSAITGTPCVALDNVSHKVSQGFEWIREVPNIRLAGSPEEIPSLIGEVLSVGSVTYDHTPLDPYYDRMREVIRSVVE